MNQTRSRTRTPVLLVLAALLVVAGCTTVLTGTPFAGARPDGTPGVSDGWIDDGTRLTVFDQVPAVTDLDPALLAALQEAAAEAEFAEMPLGINSGWRSRHYQQWLLDEAVQQYGTVEEASRWVASPDESRHISGDAVDIGPPAAAAWLETHGSRWGLCRVFANEPWHFELTGTDGTCPALLTDASG